MREEKKMSDFGPSTFAAMIAAGAEVPVFIPGETNKRVPIAEFALADAGALTDAASVDVANNATQQLASSQSALTLNVNCVTGEVPNFAVEITASADITLTVTKTVGSTVTALWPSEAGGTSLESGKFYQITCVGNCWTMAEFIDPNAQRSVSQQELEESETRREDEPESSSSEDGNDNGDNSEGEK